MGGSPFELLLAQQQQMFGSTSFGLGSPLGGRLLGGLGSPQLPQQMPSLRPNEICKSVAKKTLSFIQTLRNEIDEWLKL